MNLQVKSREPHDAMGDLWYTCRSGIIQAPPLESLTSLAFVTI